MKKRPTIAEMRRTLELIAGYVLPVYTVNERKMVPVANAEALRQFARAVLRQEPTE